MTDDLYHSLLLQWLTKWCTQKPTLSHSYSTFLYQPVFPLLPVAFHPPLRRLTTIRIRKAFQDRLIWRHILVDYIVPPSFLSFFLFREIALKTDISTQELKAYKKRSFFLQGILENTFFIVAYESILNITLKSIKYGLNFNTLSEVKKYLKHFKITVHRW